MKSKFFPIAFFLLLVILTYGLMWNGCNSAHAQGRGDKAPATQSVRDSTIILRLFHPDLRDTLVFQSATGNAPLADSAITLRLQKLTTGHFIATSADSLYKMLIDSADWARFVRAGGLTSRAVFSATAFDSLQGTSNYASNWVLYSTHARGADSAAFAQYSFTSGTADYALHYIGTDTISAARYANVAGYAAVAGSAITTQQDFTAQQWADIADTIAAAGASDSVTQAKRADSLNALAIDSYGMFTTTIKNDYLTTPDLRDALDGAADALNSANVAIDHNTLSKGYARTRNSQDSLTIGLAGTGFTQSGRRATMTIDTTTADSAFMTVWDRNSTKWLFPDTNMVGDRVDRKVTAALTTYVQNGSGTVPVTLHNTVGDPSGPTGAVGDWAINTVGGALWVKTGASTWTLVSSGGASSDSAIYLVIGGTAIHVDSVAIKTKTNTFTQAQTFNAISDFSGNAKFDSIEARSGDKINFVAGDTLWGHFQIGGAATANQPDARINQLTVSDYAIINGDLEIGNIYPSAAGKAIGAGTATGDLWDLMYLRQLYMEGNATDGQALLTVANNGSSEAFQVTAAASGSNVTLSSADLNVNSATLTVTSGDITNTGGTANLPTINVGGGSGWNTTALTLADPDYLDITGATGAIYLRSGAELRVPNDSSNSFSDIATGSTQYYLTSTGEKNALRTPCPDLSGTNYVISKDWMKEFWTRRLWPTGLFKQKKDSLRAIYGTFKNPGCNDTVDFNSFNNAELVWPIDTTAVPIEWPDTAQALILPWITPGIPVGPYWIDSTSNGIYYADPTPGYGEGILKVDQRTNDTLGFINGRYKTIKTALDSLVNFRCNVGTDSTLNAETGAAAAELDTFTLRTKNAAGNWMLKMYRGSVMVQDSIRKDLPDFITEAGAWVKFEKTGEAAQRWLQVECWLNDSVFTVRDSVIRAATIDSTWTLTFAKKQTILVYPPVDGQYINLAAACTIGDYCPVKIKGVDKNNVVITNKDRDPTPSVSQLFAVSGVGVNDTYLGMPIEFEDLTLYYEPIGGTVLPTIQVAGNAKFTNCNMIVKSTGATTNPFIQFNYYDAATITEANRPTLIVDNCVVIADSDVTVFELAADSITFQSSNCSYSISGDDGIIVYASDVWGDDPPRFSRDDFFFGTTGGGALGIVVETNQNPAGSNEKIPAPACVFIGKDPGTPGNFLNMPSASEVFQYSTQLFWDSNDTKPPAKLRDGAIPVKPKWSPK